MQIVDRQGRFVYTGPFRSARKTTAEKLRPMSEQKDIAHISGRYQIVSGLATAVVGGVLAIIGAYLTGFLIPAADNSKKSQFQPADA